MAKFIFYGQSLVNHVRKRDVDGLEDAVGPQEVSVLLLFRAREVFFSPPNDSTQKCDPFHVTPENQYLYSDLSHASMTSILFRGRLSQALLLFFMSLTFLLQYIAMYFLLLTIFT